MNAFSTWNYNLWFYHHALSHPGFTNTDKDADVYHLKPYLKKHHKQKPGIMSSFLFPSIVYILPGFYYGQTLVYMLSTIYGTLFSHRVKIPRNNYSIFDITLILTRIIIFYYMGIYSAISHMIACNVFYHINVMGDHDTYDVSVENHYEGKDWLKLQVQNSGNFKVDCPIYTYVFGGINYQIEHHLFPSMSNAFYTQISPTVQQYCKDKNIQYIVHKSLFEVFQQYYKTLKHFNS